MPGHAPGFSFALHLLRVQGFSFCQSVREPLTSIYNVLSAFHANYTATTLKAFAELCRGFSVDLLHSRTRNTADAQADYTPASQCWRAYRQALHLHRYQIPPTRRTMYREGQPHYYNKVYIRVQRCAPVMDPCQTAHLLRVQRLHLYRVSQALSTQRAVQRKRQRAGGTIDGYRRISFRAFAR